MALRDRISVSSYNGDGVINGFGIIHPDSFDEAIHVMGRHDGNLFYYDIAEQVVKPCLDSDVTISHTGTLTQGTLVQVTNIPPNSQINVSSMGLIDVDDGFLDIATSAALGELKITARTPHYKPVTWMLEVVSP